MKINTLTIISILCCLFYSCKQPIARKPVSQKSGSYIKQSIERNQQLKEEEEKYILKLIEKDTASSYIKSGNGFWYKYISKDSISNPKPVFGDVVNFDYNLKYINGNIIYSKEELKNQTYVVDKGVLFYGLREAIKLLQTGEVASFIFPSQHAYGYYGDEKKIGPNVPVISEVTVNSISKN